MQASVYNHKSQCFTYPLLLESNLRNTNMDLEIIWRHGRAMYTALPSSYQLPESSQSSSLRAAFSVTTSHEKTHTEAPFPEGLGHFSDGLQIGLILLKTCWCFLRAPHKDGTGSSEGPPQRKHSRISRQLLILPNQVRYLMVQLVTAR